MKKVTVFVASARKKSTYGAARQFLDNLCSYGDVEGEMVMLSDYRLETCHGCIQCFMQGEEFCPFQDDRDALIEKMVASDGVVFATPNYSFQVSAIMKQFLDRLGFFFHRPRFFGKTFTNIVAQGIYGGDRIVKYLDFVGSGLGFNTVKGTCITALDPMIENEKRRIDKALGQQSKRFHDRMLAEPFPKPTLFKLMAFRSARTFIKHELGPGDRDYQYFEGKGWFESDYFYPVRLGPLGKATGSLFDWLQARWIKKRKAKR